MCRNVRGSGEGGNMSNTGRGILQNSVIINTFSHFLPLLLFTTDGSETLVSVQLRMEVPGIQSQI